MWKFTAIVAIAAAVAATLLPGTALALSDAELEKFAVNTTYQVTAGTKDGNTYSPELAVTSGSDSITFVTNHIPSHATGDAYTNPITTYISPVSTTLVMPKAPVAAASTTCLPSGTVGIAVNGVSIFSAYSRPCTDAVADEAIGFDACDGHPEEIGTYHYHYKADCLETKVGSGEFVTNMTSQALYGVALDGFPIYNKWDANGTEITNAALDDCHGYDAGDGIGYRYIVNDEFPYIIGCFKGTPTDSISCHCNGVNDAADSKVPTAAATAAATETLTLTLISVGCLLTHLLD